MENKLFMILLGCRPQGRLTEQHDIFFGAAPSLSALVPAIKAFWPGPHSIHIDAYRVVSAVGGYQVSVGERARNDLQDDALKLYFINLGGYNPPDFEEYHKKMLVVAPSMAKALALAKKDTFFKHGESLSKAARPHIDDKMDVDDIICVNEQLPGFALTITEAEIISGEVEEFIGYLPLSKV